LPGKESHLVKTARLLILGSVLAILHVAAANAAVSVSHFVTQETVPVGGTFDVDVIAAYDGSPIMTGIFVSAGWDPAQLMLINTPTAPNFVIFCGGAGCLTKVADPGNFTGDPEGTLRTVQYGANPGQSGGAGDDVVITTLQFEVLSEGDGTAEVAGFGSPGVLGPRFGCAHCRMAESPPLAGRACCFDFFVLEQTPSPLHAGAASAFRVTPTNVARVASPRFRDQPLG
jgi:hypothetical protein